MRGGEQLARPRGYLTICIEDSAGGTVVFLRELNRLPAVSPLLTLTMKTKHLVIFAATAAGLALFAGCVTHLAPPQDTTKYTVENTEKFVLLDEPTQLAISCTGLQEIVQPDGHLLEVVANVKNRGSEPTPIEINCVFKDDQGFSIGEEMPFQTYILAGRLTAVVHFKAPGLTARKYTIHVRQVRPDPGHP